jgi:hypothetical protein
MTRLEKIRDSWYAIGNDRANDVYDNIIRKCPGFSHLHFALVENLYHNWSKVWGYSWVPTTPENVLKFYAWTQEEAPEEDE